MSIDLKILKNLSKEQIKKLLKKKRLLKEGKQKISSGSKKTKKSKSKKLSKEKIYEMEMQRSVDRKKTKEERRESIETSKLNRELRNTLYKLNRENVAVLEKEFVKAFKEQVEKLNDKGLFYKCEYKEMDIDKIANTGIIKIGEQGWKFCFEHNGKAFFERMLGGKKDE